MELTDDMINRGAVAAIASLLYGIELPSPNPLYYFTDKSNGLEFYIYHGTVPSPAIYKSQIKALKEGLKNNLNLCKWFFYLEAAGDWQRQNREMVAMMQGWSGWNILQGDPTYLGAVSLARMKVGVDQKWINDNFTKEIIKSMVDQADIKEQVELSVHKFSTDKF